MKRLFLTLGCLLSLALYLPAQSPTPAGLLPTDTLAVLSVPDLDRAKASFQANPAAQLYQDPALKPFLTKFTNKLQAEVIAPLEKDLGIKLSDYASLARGQMTVAVVRDGWEGQKGQAPAVVLLIDSKDKAPEVRAKLEELRKRWVDKGKTVRSEKIRDAEFSVLILPAGELGKAFAGQDTENRGGADKVEVLVGQSGSMLLVSNSRRVCEKIMIRQGGGTLPALEELPAFESLQATLFRDAAVFAWVNAETLLDIAFKRLAEDQRNNPGAAANNQQPLQTPSADRILDAVGLRGLKSLSFRLALTPAGSQGEMYLALPAAQRKGLFQILAPEAKDSAPPPFIPADVTKFFRWRLDGQKLWAAIESTVTTISPQMNGILQMTLGAAGKDKDPNFDLKKQLIGNLGDDLMGYEKPPRGTSLDELTSPPSLYLVGSQNAEQLTAAVRTGTGFLNAMGGDATAKEREFLGRKIYSLPLMPGVSADGKKPKERALHYAASGGYLALSTDVSMLEEYLRTAQNPGRPLQELAGLAEAAQQVGGQGTGFLSYENQTQTLRLLVDGLRQNPDLFENLFPANPLTDPGASSEQRKKRAEWLDFSLLPPFGQIEKYFHYTVSGMAADERGISVRIFSPTPPQLKP